MPKILSERATRPEIMDDFGVAGDDVHSALQEVNKINQWLGGHQVTMDGLKRIIQYYEQGPVKQPIRILDVGCGGGDTLKRIQQWGDQNGYSFELTGLDANPHIIQYARENFPDSSVKWISEDIRHFSVREQEYDIIHCGLFCHHLPTETLNTLLRQLYQQARWAVLINDLHRHWLAYGSIWGLTRLFRCSEMVQHDAPLSVHKGFTKKELERFLHRLNISDYTLQWKWAFRYLLILWKSKTS